MRSSGYSQLGCPFGESLWLAAGGDSRPDQQTKTPYTPPPMIKKSMLAMAVLAAFAIGAPSTAFCATKKDKPATPDPAKAPAETTKSIPYHGKVASVDAAAKTFTIKGLKKDRLFSTTDKTVITKDGAPARHRGYYRGRRSPGFGEEIRR